jgi:hypothetical protein
MATSGKKGYGKGSFGNAASYVKMDAPAGYIPDALPEYNWKGDKQPMVLPDFGSHIAVAKAMAPAFIELHADILIAAGYAPASKKADIIKGMTAATGYEVDDHGRETTTKKEFHLDGVSFRWRVKKESACDIKVVAAMKEGKTKDRQDVGDYIGCKLIGATIEDVVRLRNAARLVEHRMTSRKCEYSHPSAEGFRSHKSHHLVEATVSTKDIPAAYRDDILALYPANEDGTIKLSTKGELMIRDRAGEDIEQFTHSLKMAELSLEDASHIFAKVAKPLAEAVSERTDKREARKGTGQGMPARMTKFAEEIRQWREYFNDFCADRAGLDALALPGRERGTPTPPDHPHMRVKAIILNNRSGIPEILAAPVAEFLGHTSARGREAGMEHRYH